jgi:tRNA 5-methylaminomethyl-2-thiouridine biosynthesis bifunctional protein
VAGCTRLGLRGVKTAAITPAQVVRDADGTPVAPAYGDVYHPRGGALAQARHVFLAGNGLPARWAQRRRFVILETGFGLGNNFLATWEAWCAAPQRGELLQFISIEQHPLRREDLIEFHRGSALAPLADQLADAWPPLTCNLHRLAFDDARVQLLLCLGDVSAWLPELVAQVDAFYLDGFAPARNPDMWQPRLFKALARLAAPEATAATWSAARIVRDGLSAAGFEVARAPGSGAKRDITLARFAPRFTPRRAPARRAAASQAQRAVIVGGGLAGCALAWALAERGWRTRVIDRHPEPAGEASGNPAGLFHGIVNAQDGAHARLHRAAALEASRAVADAIAQHQVAGRIGGLIRLETMPGDVAAMQRIVATLGLPADYVQALDAEAASARAGIHLLHPAWFFPGGGWVDPRGLARSFLARAGTRCDWSGGLQIDRIDASPQGWRLLDLAGDTIDAAEVVVLANGADSLRLLDAPPWPIESIRGQLSGLDAAHVRAHRWPRPHLPIAGAGYLLPHDDGSLWFGATTQADDVDPAVRLADHRVNIAQLEHLLGQPLALDLSELRGRTGWRCTSRDRLPLIGAVPDLHGLADTPASATPRLDQARFVPRRPGLFVFTALGSRGIIWAALGAQVLSAWISGDPIPLEADLLDAVDPARFVARAARRPRNP